MAPAACFLLSVATEAQIFQMETSVEYLRKTANQCNAAQLCENKAIALFFLQVRNTLWCFLTLSAVFLFARFFSGHHVVFYIMKMPSVCSDKEVSPSWKI